MLEVVPAAGPAVGDSDRGKGWVMLPIRSRAARGGYNGSLVYWTNIP